MPVCVSSKLLGSEGLHGGGKACLVTGSCCAIKITDCEMKNGTAFGGCSPLETDGVQRPVCMFPNNKNAKNLCSTLQLLNKYVTKQIIPEAVK